MSKEETTYAKVLGQLRESVIRLDEMSHELVTQAQEGTRQSDGTLKALGPKDIASLAQALSAVERLSVDTKIKILTLEREEAQETGGSQTFQISVPPMPLLP